MGLAAGLLLLTVAERPGNAGAPGPILPDSEYPKMVKYSVKGLQDALKGGNPKEELVVKARTAAILIAACAQQNLDAADGQQRATVRDAALKLADTIQKKNFAEALKQAEALASLPADPKAKKEKLKLIDTHVQFRDLMYQFKRPPDGGWGIDSKLYAYRLGMKSKIPFADFNDTFLMEAYQVAVTADIVMAREVKDKQKEWETIASDLRAGALQLAGAVKDKDGGSGMEAVTKVTTTCTRCHKAFRVKQ
jgi:hypothetical protein